MLIVSGANKNHFCKIFYKNKIHTYKTLHPFSTVIQTVGCKKAVGFIGDAETRWKFCPFSSIIQSELCPLFIQQCCLEIYPMISEKLSCNTKIKFKPHKVFFISTKKLIIVVFLKCLLQIFKLIKKSLCC